MAGEHFSRRNRPASHRFSPAGAFFRDLDLADHQIQHAFEDLFLVGYVLVDRHRLEAEFGTQSTHRQGAESASIGEVDRGLKNPILGQRQAGSSGV